MIVPYSLLVFQKNLSPLISLTFDPPAEDKGEWWLDVAYKNKAVQIVWTEKGGFGFFDSDDDTGFSPPTLYLKTSAEANLKLFQLFNLKSKDFKSHVYGRLKNSQISDYAADPMLNQKVNLFKNDGMKQSGGKANPAVLNTMLKEKLGIE